MTDCAALIATVQVEAVVQPAETASAPDQPVKRDPESAVAVSVTCVAGDARSKVAVHVEPQSMPPASEARVPPPEPDLAAVRTNV